MKDYCCLIPCYNEVKTIQKVVKEVQKYGYDLLVIDDGSTDRTLDKIKEITDEYVTYNINKGKGYAIKQGVRYLIDKGYDWIVIVDSDGQTPIKDIDKLLKLRQLYPKARIIIGDRLNNPLNMPKTRLYTNKIMSWMISLLAGQYISDSQCGLKIIHKDVFDLDFKCQGFDFDSEILLKAGKKKYKIVSGDIDCIYFKDRKSKMHPIEDALRFMKLIFNLISS